jgi:type III secretory pathway lipoprotein EscJ
LRLAQVALLFAAMACQENVPAKDGGDQADNSFESELGDSLIPSPADEKLKRDRALGLELARTLERLDGVAEARVHLNLADKSILSRDREKKSKAAILVKRSQKTGPDESTVRNLAAASISDLEPGDISVFFSGPSTLETKTALIGPIEVTEQTVKKAKLIIGGLLILCLVLAVGLVAAGIKLKRLKGRSQ